MVWFAYRPLHTDNDVAKEELENPEGPFDTQASSTSPNLAKYLSIAFVLLLTLNICGIIWAARTGHECQSQGSKFPSSQEQLCNCGTSAAEAKANGCKFDPYSMTWLPDQCWDEELFQAFEAIKEEQNHDFSLYTFSHRPQLISIEEAAQLAGDPWNITDNRIKTSESWHYAHCLYILLKHFRRDVTHLGIAARYMSQEHAQHCVKTIMGLVATDPAAHDASGVSAVYIFND